MIKVIKIKCLKGFQIHCFFNNGEERLLNLSTILKDAYSKKIMNELIFKKAKIGALGQIYWEGVAQIKELNGSLSPCAYDMSGEFVYHNAKPFKNG